eukprot:gene1547-4696_t
MSKEDLYNIDPTCIQGLPGSLNVSQQDKYIIHEDDDDHLQNEGQLNFHGGVTHMSCMVASSHEDLSSRTGVLTAKMTASEQAMVANSNQEKFCGLMDSHDAFPHISSRFNPCVSYSNSIGTAASLVSFGDQGNNNIHALQERGIYSHDSNQPALCLDKQAHSMEGPTRIPMQGSRYSGLNDTLLKLPNQSGLNDLNHPGCINTRSFTYSKRGDYLPQQRDEPFYYEDISSSKSQTPQETIKFDRQYEDQLNSNQYFKNQSFSDRETQPPLQREFTSTSVPYDSRNTSFYPDGLHEFEHGQQSANETDPANLSAFSALLKTHTTTEKSPNSVPTASCPENDIGQNLTSLQRLTKTVHFRRQPEMLKSQQGDAYQSTSVNSTSLYSSSVKVDRSKIADIKLTVTNTDNRNGSNSVSSNGIHVIDRSMHRNARNAIQEGVKRAKKRGRPLGSRKRSIKTIEKDEGKEKADALRQKIESGLETLKLKEHLNSAARKILLVMTLRTMMKDINKSESEAISSVANISGVSKTKVRRIVMEWRETGTLKQRACDFEDTPSSQKNDGGKLKEKPPLANKQRKSDSSQSTSLNDHHSHQYFEEYDHGRQESPAILRNIENITSCVTPHRSLSNSYLQNGSTIHTSSELPSSTFSQSMLLQGRPDIPPAHLQDTEANIFQHWHSSVLQERPLCTGDGASFPSVVDIPYGGGADTAQHFLQYFSVGNDVGSHVQPPPPSWMQLHNNDHHIHQQQYLNLHKQSLQESHE